MLAMVLSMAARLGRAHFSREISLLKLKPVSLTPWMLTGLAPYPSSSQHSTEQQKIISLGWTWFVTVTQI
jgi:hypothetical protein